jgi:hypothetical protein
MPAVSGAGIRQLDDTDLPQVHPRSGNAIVCTHPKLTPFGVEITLPVGARMPADFYYEFDAYTFEHHKEHPSLMQSQGTGLAWMADMIEFFLMRRGFSTIFRSFHLGQEGFRVKLYLLQESSHLSGDSLTKLICDHSYMIRGSGTNPSAPDPGATNLRFPGREIKTYLFPCPVAISQWPDTDDVIYRREAYRARYPRVLEPLASAPLD